MRSPLALPGALPFVDGSCGVHDDGVRTFLPFTALANGKPAITRLTRYPLIIPFGLATIESEQRQLLQFIGDFCKPSRSASLILVAARRPAHANRANRLVSRLHRQSARYAKRLGNNPRG